MRIVYFFALSLFLNAGLALAQSGPAVLTILPGWQTESGTNLAAFEISLEPGWKTYWRAPGDSGIPPRVDWKGSTNVGAVEFHWPRPGIFDELGTRTVGYKDRLVLPVEFTPKNPGKPITAAGELEIGVCLDVCVPMSFRFSAELPQAGSPDRQIQNALAQKAEQVAGDGIPGLGCVFDPISDGLRVEARFDNSPLKDSKAAIFEHRDRGIWIGAAEIQKTGSGLTIIADLVPPNAKPFAIDRSMITLTLLGDNSALEVSGCPAG